MFLCNINVVKLVSGGAISYSGALRMITYFTLVRGEFGRVCKVLVRLYSAHAQHTLMVFCIPCSIPPYTDSTHDILVQRYFWNTVRTTSAYIPLS